MSTHRFDHQNRHFELRTRERRLLVDGEAATLGQRALDLLTALVERAGQTVSRRDLVECVWPDADVTEGNLSVQVNALRKALGHEAIATIPGRGYAFTPRVQGLSGGSAPAAPAPQRLPANLPAVLPTLIGRDTALQVLNRLVEQHRVLTLLGPGGIGKTLLAQHLLQRHAQRLRHGVCFVDLSMLGDASLIPGAMAAALRVNVGGGDALGALADALAPLDILVVLDGAECLLDGVAGVVARLHQAAPQLRLLVTSQAPLKLGAEHVHRLDALDIPDAALPAQDALRYGALALFVERARAADSRFALRDADVPAAIALCRTLEGMPLAIELAAWRAPVLGVAPLADAMQDRLMLLNFARRDAPPRMQSLRAALEWSHALLSPVEQVVLRRLAVLAGSTGLALLRQVVADPAGGPIDEWTVVDVLTTLADRSLVAVVPGWGGEPRYRLLDTPRAFAAERLAASGEAPALRQRHAEAVAAAFDEAYAQRASGRVGMADWDERQVDERDNGFQALAWLRQRGDRPTLLRLMPGLVLSAPREDRNRCLDLVHLSQALTREAPASPAVMHALLATARYANALLKRGGFDHADAAVRVARECAAQLPDARWLYLALSLRAVALFTGDDLAGGEASLMEARALEVPGWPAPLHAARWTAEVWLADRRMDGPAMYSASLRTAEVYRQAGHSAWQCELHLINGAMAVGRAEEAARHGLSIVAQLEGGRHERGLADARFQLVQALASSGRLDEAMVQSRLAWPLALRLGLTSHWADAHLLLAAHQQQHGLAAQLLGYANGRNRQQGLHVRAHNEALAVQQALALVQARLDPATLAGLQCAGSELRDEDIPALAFAPAA
ncbi:putative ATPase [Burkholderiales bacterium JOSHI_001]|nr:putative ATPase [Burkholderiales bacterium JOSHI_001]